jgi:predicted molibdopterin-dependent oxidoreductase YjgC
LLEKYPLVLSTGNRNIYYPRGQFRKVKSLKEKNPEPKAELGPKTATKFGIKGGGDIFIEMNREIVRMKARADERVAGGVVLIRHGWPGEANANILTDTLCRESIMRYPDMKSVLCAIRRA